MSAGAPSTHDGPALPSSPAAITGRSVRGAAVWAMAGQYLSFAMQFATSVAISRFFLSPAEVGLFSIGLAAALLASTLQDFGLTRYISGLPTIDTDAIARCSTVALGFSLVVAAVIAVSAWPLSAVYGEPRLRDVVWLIGASYLLMPLSVVPMALLARDMNFRGHFLINVGGSAVQAAVALALAASGFSSLALAWGTLAWGAARGLIAQALRPALPWPPRFDGLRPIVGTGSRLSVLYFSGALGTRTPDLLVGKLLGLFAVGLYSRAVSLSDQFRMLISGAIGSVFFPAFARLRDRGEALGPPYLRVVAGYTAVIWPGMAGLALAAEPLVRLLYGSAWSGVAQPLALIALAEIVLVAVPLHIDLPVLLGRLNRLLAINAADTVLSLALLAAGCLWGVAGAAGSRLVYAALWLALYGPFLHKLVRFDLRALGAIYARSAVVTAAALLPLALCYRLYHGPAEIGFVPMMLAALAGAGLWLLALIGVRHPALRDLAGLAEHLPLPSRWRPGALAHSTR